MAPRAKEGDVSSAPDLIPGCTHCTHLAVPPGTPREIEKDTV